MVKRNEVDIKETWKLEDLFENDEKFYEELDKTVKKSENFKKTYSQIDSSDKLYKGLKDLSEIYGAMHRLGSFAGISTEVDANDPYPQKDMQILGQRQVEFMQI